MLCHLQLEFINREDGKTLEPNPNRQKYCRYRTVILQDHLDTNSRFVIVRRPWLMSAYITHGLTQPILRPTFYFYQVSNSRSTLGSVVAPPAGYLILLTKDVSRHSIDARHSIVDCGMMLDRRVQFMVKVQLLRRLRHAAVYRKRITKIVQQEYSSFVGRLLSIVQ